MLLDLPESWLRVVGDEQDQPCFRELRNDTGCHIPNIGYLVPRARQGVLLLTTVFAARAHAPNSHRGKG